MKLLAEVPRRGYHATLPMRFKEEAMPQDNACTMLAPVDRFAGEENLLSARAQQRWLLALLLIGLALRLTRYLLRFPLWEDEAMLSANLIDRGYRELLQPLHYCQVAPRSSSGGN